MISLSAERFALQTRASPDDRAELSLVWIVFRNAHLFP